MTLERIAVLHKVLAQISPAGSPHNVTAGVSALRTALASHSAHAWLSAASAAVTVGELKAWWQAFDAALTTRHVERLLDAVEALLDGGRVWALMGQPQPALEMLLMADEEARAATCRSRCGSSIGMGGDGASDGTGGSAQGETASGHRELAPSRKPSTPGGRLPLSSRDEWVVSSMGSMDDLGTASASSSSAGGGSLSAAAAAAAAAANAAAEAAAVAPSCALDDRDCQDCSGRCARRPTLANSCSLLPILNASSGGALYARLCPPLGCLSRYWAACMGQLTTPCTSVHGAFLQVWQPCGEGLCVWRPAQ